MPYNTKEKKLTIDLSKENYDPKILLTHKEVTCIRIDECIEQFEFPKALKGYKTLTELYISGKKKELLYPPPVHLEKLTNIKKLSLWSFCDLKQLKPMPHIETLNIVIKDSYVDTQVISSIFPNLIKMEIWGSHQKSGELPPEIGEFKHLEHLELVSCGLTDLPSEFKKLTSLKSLNMRGLVMRIFPKVLCEMDRLEELVFRQHIVNLPNNFSNLKALKKLDFSQAFNKGTTSPVNKWSDRPSYLHPIPDVIGKLPSLQELDLSFCGVIDLAFLKPLKNLKRLKLEYSGLPDCNELSNFNSLEVLSLESAEILADIKGLVRLPIKNLNMERCYELKSIDPILELPTLEELNIKYCDSLKSLDAIYQHPNLRVLKASQALVKKWELKEQYKNIPPLDAVIDNLSSEDVVLVEKAINDLALHVDKNYYEDENPLAGYFGKENDDEAVNLPILDTAFKKYNEKLSVDTLINLIKMSFQSVGEDNYTITLLAIQEIIKRKDVGAQQQVVAQFKKACASYDFGHRYWENTVHVQLFDDLFPAFESVALIDLLTDGHGDMLNCEGGDEGDRLFIPAFRKCKKTVDFDSLLTAFFDYQDESIEYHGLQYFETLHTDILAVLTREYTQKFIAEMKKRNAQTNLLTLLESDDPKDIEQLIDALDKPENGKFVESNDYKILEKINRLDISLNYVTTALDFFINKKEGASYVPNTLVKYILPKGSNTIVTYLKTKENSDNKEYLGKIISKIIHDLNMKNHSIKDIPPFREYLKKLTNYNDVAVYSIEIKKLLKAITDVHVYDDTFHKIINRFEQIVSLVKHPPIEIKGSDVKWNLWMMANGADTKQWNVIKRLCKALFIVIPLKYTVDALFIAVVSASMTEDYEFLKYLKQYIPETIEDELLAYNLACAFAKFSKKEAMLKYGKRSIELGKTKAQFLNDKDFTQYKDDKDFLNLCGL